MIALVMTLALAALPAQPGVGAGQAGTIAGVVFDTDGAVVPDAKVEAAGPVRQLGQSDAAGQFRLTGLRPGLYRVSIARDGFATSRWEVTVGSTEAPLSVTLQIAPVAETIVTVSKVAEASLRAPFLVTSVPASELRDTAAATFDEALRSVAGLQHGTQGNAFTRVATRGLRDTADVLVLLDGVPFRQLNGAADLTMIPVSMLQGVEFVKGTASSVYGRSAVGGVMQFFTVPDATVRLGGDVALSAASFGTYEGQGSLSVPYRQGRLAAAASASTSDGFQQGVGRDTRFATVVSDYHFGARASLRLNYLASTVQAVRGSIVPLAAGEPLFGISREDNFGIPGARFDGTLHSFSGKFNGQVRPAVVLTNVFNVNRYSRFSTGGITVVPPPTAATKGWSESEATQDTWLNDTLVEWQASRGALKSALIGGTTVEWGDQNQASPVFTAAPTYRGPDYRTPVSNVNNDPRGIRGAETTSLFDQSIASAYVQERLQVGRASVTGGLRWDRFHQTLTRSDTAVVSDVTGSKVSPRVAGDVTVWGTGNWQTVAFGNYTRGFRPQFPSLSTLNGVTVPQLLRPEVTRNVEGGLRAASNRLSGQVAVFNMRKVDGQRSFRSGPEDFVFVNATSEVKGLEGEIRSRLRGGHAVYANYAYQAARNVEFRPTLTTNFDGSRLRMTPRHIAGAGLTVAHGPVAASGGVAYVGPRPLRDNTLTPQVLPSYALLHASLSVKMRGAQLVLSGTNLTDAYYIADDFSSQDAGNPGMPRRVLLQIRQRF